MSGKRAREVRRSVAKDVAVLIPLASQTRRGAVVGRRLVKKLRALARSSGVPRTTPLSLFQRPNGVTIRWGRS